MQTSIFLLISLVVAGCLAEESANPTAEEVKAQKYQNASAERIQGLSNKFEQLQQALGKNNASESQQASNTAAANVEKLQSSFDTFKEEFDGLKAALVQYLELNPRANATFETHQIEQADADNAMSEAAQAADEAEAAAKDAQRIAEDARKKAQAVTSVLPSNTQKGDKTPLGKSKNLDWKLAHAKNMRDALIKKTKAYAYLYHANAVVAHCKAEFNAKQSLYRSKNITLEHATKMFAKVEMEKKKADAELAVAKTELENAKKALAELSLTENRDLTNGVSVGSARAAFNAEKAKLRTAVHQAQAAFNSKLAVAKAKNHPFELYQRMKEKAEDAVSEAKAEFESAKTGLYEEEIKQKKANEEYQEAIRKVEDVQIESSP